MFSLFDSLLANKGAWMWHECDTRKCVNSRDFVIIFLQNIFYPYVEFYGLKDSAEKHVSNGKVFYVGGLFYSIIDMSNWSDIYYKKLHFQDRLQNQQISGLEILQKCFTSKKPRHSTNSDAVLWYKSNGTNFKSIRKRFGPSWRITSAYNGWYNFNILNCYLLIYNKYLRKLAERGFSNSARSVFLLRERIFSENFTRNKAIGRSVTISCL